MNHHHSNPTISILIGSGLGITSYLSDTHFMVDNSLALIKVISFGFIGGAFGAIGRLAVLSLVKKLKNRNS